MVPGMTLMAPANGEELRDMIWTAVRLQPAAKGPIAVRFPRAPIPETVLPQRPPALIAPGTAQQLRAGGDVALIALGTMVLPALAAADLLAAEGVSATVVNARYVCPLDERVITGLARSVGRIVTIEENVPMGGFGSAVSECLDRNDLSSTPLLRIALPERFVLHGRRDALLEQVGLDGPGIARRTREWIRALQPHFS